MPGIADSIPNTEIDRQLAALSQAKGRWMLVPLAERIRLAEACLEGVVRAADAWTKTACSAKGVDSRAVGAEEMASGPLATARFLRLLIHSLFGVLTNGRPALPGPLVENADGRLQVPVFPVPPLYDHLLVPGFQVRTWLAAGRSAEGLFAHLNTERGDSARQPGVALVLGAGNVSSIPAVDALGKLFQSGQVVLLKLNPINDYLRPIFETAFRPIIEAGWLRLASGGADVGAYAVAHAAVDEVHITGSAAAYETIVWGAPGAERDERRAGGKPLLEKPISSELGNVTPWIVLPDEYSERQLDFQAENVAAGITNNASFNCIALKMIVTWRGWPQRQRFLDKIAAALGRIPQRRAYYPGAAQRYRRFTGREPDSGSPQAALPWTLLGDVTLQRDPLLFREESFVCVCAETALDAESEAEFLDRSVDFANEQLWGTLAVGLMVSPRFRRRGQNEARLWQAIARLRYGLVALNHWPGVGFAMMSPPWGGFPGSTPADPQSGQGWVHNTFLLEGIEKSVLEGPLVVWPKPFWFPSHRQAATLTRRLVGFYGRPAWWKLPALVPPALGGGC